mgnify:CR=1 FL=1
MKLHYLRVYYAFKDYDCTNNGISADNYNLIRIELEPGETLESVIPQLKEPLNKYVIFEESHLPSYEPLPHLIPIISKKPHSVGWMSGGNVCVEYGDKFGNGAIRGVWKLHDRQETQEEYDSYNN